MRRITIAALVLALLGLASAVQAQEQAADPTGTWTFAMGQNAERAITIKLKLEKAEGGQNKLTGVMVARNNQETPLTDASFKDGVVAFSVVRERNDQKVTTKYSGKLTGDTIKGTQTISRGDQERTRDWEAKRAPAAAPK